MENIEVSFVILTWNSCTYIDRCMQSIIKDSGDSNIDVEIIIVDNGSCDNTCEIVTSYENVTNIKLIKLKYNMGTTYSRNLALKQATGKYIFILDSDTEILEGSLAKLIRVANQYKDIGIIAPRLIYANGDLQASFRKFPTFFVKFSKFMPLKSLKIAGEKDELYDEKHYKMNFNEILNVDYCISAAWFLKREVIEKVGYLDENIFYAPEDVDYCVRMWLSGLRVIYFPFACVKHHYQRISHKSIKFSISHIKGLIYYFKKHKYLFSRKSLYKKISFDLSRED